LPERRRGFFVARGNEGQELQSSRGDGWPSSLRA
jgi:hypothetical protein